MALSREEERGDGRRSGVDDEEGRKEISVGGRLVERGRGKREVRGRRR